MNIEEQKEYIGQYADKELIQRVIDLKKEKDSLYKIINLWEKNDALKTQDIANHEQTISQLRANVERLRAEKDEAVRRNIDLTIIEESLQTEIIGLREENEEAKKEILELQTLAPFGSLEWAIAQMRQGKKVCRTSWKREPKPFAYIDNDGKYSRIVDNSGWSTSALLFLNDWQLYEEPKKELAVGQRWECSEGSKREIIGMRRPWVVYYLNDGDMCREDFYTTFFEKFAHKLLGDAE